MKKILSLSFCLVVLFSFFTVNAAATASGGDLPLLNKEKIGDVYYSKDYGKLTIGEYSYTAIDDETVEIFDYYDTGSADYYETEDDGYIAVDLTESQKKTVKELEISIGGDNDYIYATYTLNSNAYVSATYINNKHLESYNKAISGDGNKVKIDFSYPEGNVVNTTTEKLKQTKVEIELITYNIYDEFNAYNASVPNFMNIYCGRLVLQDEKYYYIDFKELGITVYDFYNIVDSGEKVAVYLIEDPKLLSEIEESYNEYNGEFTLLLDEEFTVTFALILAVAVFGILPLAVLILSIIFGLRSKAKYRKILFALGAIALAELIIFAVIFIIFNIK